MTRCKLTPHEYIEGLRFWYQTNGPCAHRNLTDDERRAMGWPVEADADE